MIKHKLSKDKFIGIINGISIITDKLLKDRNSMPYDMLRATTNAQLYVLDDLSRKMRSKLVMIEDKPGKHAFTYSFNEMQALIMMVHKDICRQEPYIYLSLTEIYEIGSKKLLQ